MSNRGSWPFLSKDQVRYAIWDNIFKEYQQKGLKDSSTGALISDLEELPGNTNKKKRPKVLANIKLDQLNRSRKKSQQMKKSSKSNKNNDSSLLKNKQTNTNKAKQGNENMSSVTSKSKGKPANKSVEPPLQTNVKSKALKQVLNESIRKTTAYTRTSDVADSQVSSTLSKQKLFGSQDLVKYYGMNLELLKQAANKIEVELKSEFAYKLCKRLEMAEKGVVNNDKYSFWNTAVEDEFTRLQEFVELQELVEYIKFYTALNSLTKKEICVSEIIDPLKLDIQ